MEEGRYDIQGLAIFNVSYSTIDRRWTRFSETGEYKSKAKGENRKKKLNQWHIDYIEELWTSRKTFSTCLLRQHNDNKPSFFKDETGFKLEMAILLGVVMQKISFLIYDQEISMRLLL